MLLYKKIIIEYKKCWEKNQSKNDKMKNICKKLLKMFVITKESFQSTPSL